MLAFIVSDNSGFTDCLADVAFALCETREENIYLADFLACSGSFYYQEAVATIYRKCGEGARKSKGGSSDLDRYVFDYFRAKEDEKSLEKLYEILQKRPCGQGVILELMHQYYREKGGVWATERDDTETVFSCRR